MVRAVIMASCPCCGEDQESVCIPPALAEALADSGYIAGWVARGSIYLALTVCPVCLSAAAAGDSAPSGVDFAPEFYHALVREV